MRSHNTVAAGVVVVIAAGNDRDDFGTRLGRLARHGAGRDLRRGGLEHARVRAFARRDRARARQTRCRASRSSARTERARPMRGARPISNSSTSARSSAPTAGRSSGTCAARPTTLAQARGTLPSGSLTGAIALVQRGICPLAEKAEQATGRGRDRDRLSPTTARARRTRSRSGSPHSGQARSRTSTATGCARTWHRTAAARRCASARAPLELETGRSGVITSFSSAGPTAFGHDLKPDVSAPGGQILSSTLPNTSALALRRLRRHLDGDAARRGLGRAPRSSCTRAGRRHRSSRRSSRRPRLRGRDTARTQEAPVTLEGGGLVALPRRERPRALHRPVLALLRGPRRAARRRRAAACSCG